MSEAHQDPAIKLFGKTIPLRLCSSENSVISEDRGGGGNHDLFSNQDFHNSPETSQVLLQDKNSEVRKSTEANEKDGASAMALEKLTIPSTSSGMNDNPKTPSSDKENALHKMEEENSETSVSQDKTLKKLDKILPCPRCNSMDTKFCYYNNYNVNQPRHFCKNCQRYWTAGGTMRNVPVGAGRRKNKNSATHYRQLSVSEAIHTANTNISDGWNSAVPPPGFCASSFPIPFYPAAPYWGCAVPGNWSLPWLTPSSSSPITGGPPGSSTTLGKHLREGDTVKQNVPVNEDKPAQGNSSEKSLWIPKTLRIDDPGEAARSSIWATLGIKNYIADSICGGSLFKAFQLKASQKNHVTETSQMLQANPAALSRSLNFQESS